MDVLIFSCAVILLTERAASSCPSACSCNREALVCSEQELTKIPSFKGSLQPYILDLSGNDIEEVRTSSFFTKKFLHLKYLYLNSNTITDMEVTAFSTLPELQFLDLSFNLLQEVPAHFIQRNSKLLELNLSSNLFTYNTPELYSKSLKVLDLSFSKISLFDEGNLEGLTNLNTLYLYGNNLKDIDSKTLTTVINSHLEFVDLSFNSWECNCATIELFDSLVKVNMTLIDGTIQCLQSNKWFKIYNSEGAINAGEFCQNDYEKDQMPNDIEASVKEINKNEDLKSISKEEDNEEFIITIRYKYILWGTIGVVSLLVLTLALTITVSKLKKPKYKYDSGLWQYYKKVDSRMPNNLVQKM